MVKKRKKKRSSKSAIPKQILELLKLILEIIVIVISLMKSMGGYLILTPSGGYDNTITLKRKGKEYMKYFEQIKTVLNIVIVILLIALLISWFM